MSELSKASADEARSNLLEARKERQREQQLAQEQQLRAREVQRNREKRLDDLGLTRYLEQVEILRHTGELAPAAAEREEAWAREYAKGVEESRAEVAEINALFRQWQSEPDRLSRQSLMVVAMRSPTSPTFGTSRASSEVGRPLDAAQSTTTPASTDGFALTPPPGCSVA